MQGLWHQWLRSDRDKFLAQLAREDAAFEETLRQLETKKEEQARMLKEADARLAEYAAMERWKAEKCKRCPRCSRTIEKIDGCDAMVCGQNYHGGDVQNGCGHRFSWSSAPEYVTEAAEHLSRPSVEALPALPRRQRLRWQVEPHVFLKCAMCKEAIEGPCFLCIDCYACCACIKCANGLGAASGGKHNPDTHVFKILWSMKELRDTDLTVLASNSLTVVTCAARGCQKPAWKGVPGGHCSKACARAG